MHRTQGLGVSEHGARLSLEEGGRLLVSRPGAARHMAVAVLKVLQGRGPFALTQDGQLVASNRSRADVLLRYRTAIRNREAPPSGSAGGTGTSSSPGAPP